LIGCVYLAPHWHLVYQTYMVFARVFRILAVLALTILFDRAAIAGAAVTDVRFGKHVDMTRFVLDLSDSVKWRILMLPDPYRIVVDFPRLEWRSRTRQGVTGKGVIKRFRFGNFSSDRSRLVLDLVGPVDIHRNFVLPPQGRHPYRFVIDLKASNRGAFLDRARSLRPNRKQAAVSVPGQRLPVPRKRNRPWTIVIDPGHGGVDPGTIGRSGVYEKEIVLAVSKELRDALLKEPGYRVIMTRESDTFVRLHRRVEVARRADADLFLSIHADAIRERGIRGATVYTLSEKSSDSEAEQLANKENKSDIIAGVDLGDHTGDIAEILIDLAQRDTLTWSHQFAAALVPELSRRVRLRSKPHRFAGFRVLKAPDVPSVLIELGYLSNRDDEKMLLKATGRAQIIKAIRSAVNKYFKKRRLTAK